MEAQRILQDVIAKYKNLQSYQDHGVVYSYWSDKETPDELMFRTWFSRPQFRFDWRSHHPYPPLRHIVHHFSIVYDGATTMWWQDDPEEMKELPELRIAIARATGSPWPLRRTFRTCS